MELSKIRNILNQLVQHYVEKRDNPSKPRKFWQDFKFNPENKRYENQFAGVNPGTYRTTTSYSISQNEQRYVELAAKALGRTKSSIAEEALIMWLALHIDEIEAKGGFQS